MEGKVTVGVITPKARRGIHDINPNMSYTSQLTNTQRYRENLESYDEVDNIQSKPARASSPITVRRRFSRKSSVDAELFDQDSDSDSEDKLSKSSPAQFQIYSYYRDKHDQINDLSREASYSYSRENLSTKSETDIQDPQNKTNGGSNFKHIILTIILCVISYIVYQNYSDKNLSFKIYDRINFYNDVRSMAQKYKVKPDSMLQVRTGIDTIFQKEDAGSFIFTYDGNSFDSVQFYTFMDNISSASSRYLRNDTKNVQHVVLDSNKIITLKSDADLIHEFRDSVDKTGVLLVKNIERVPAKLAMAFHYYCDEFNPLVKKSAIFFTLDVAKCKSPASKSLINHDYIERCLNDKWRDVDSDKIAPLLTRVVNVIVDVTNM